MLAFPILEIGPDLDPGPHPLAVDRRNPARVEKRVVRQGAVVVWRDPARATVGHQVASEYLGEKNGPRGRVQNVLADRSPRIVRRVARFIGGVVAEEPGISQAQRTVAGEN